MKHIKYLTISIFSFYFIFWSYILVVSYMHTAIDFDGAKYLVINFMRYLCIVDNPFAELYWGSLNSNLLTLQKIKIIIAIIYEKCKALIL